MTTRCEVELDIFSGMPNPTWTLVGSEAETFVKRVAALAHAPASELEGNLGYRGFIVQCTTGANAQVIRIQAGVVQIVHGGATLYARDESRSVERWLLGTGKAYLKPEIFEIVERELG